MTKEDIFKMIFAAIVSAFAKPIIDAYMPEKEKIKLFIKRAIGISLSYLLPIGLLITLFFGNSPVDKSFIFQVVIFSITLVFNLILDILHQYHRSNTKDTAEAIKIVIESVGEHVNATHDIVKFLHQHVKDDSEYHQRSIEAVSELSKKLETIANEKRAP